MNAMRLLLPLAALCAADLTAQSQFDFGSLYMMSAYHAPTGGSPCPGIARVDPFNGAVTPLVQFSLGGANAASAAYDPYRDRIVAFCGIGSQANPALNAIDAAGNSTVVSTTYLVRLAPRGDGKIYGYKAGAGHPTVQQIYYVDANGQEQVLLDVGGAAPWQLNGGVPFNDNDPIRAMIYEPSENALFLALMGSNLVPDCGAPSFDVSIRKLPLTADGTALRAPASCNDYDVGGTVSGLPVFETPVGFSHGPHGTLVLGVHTNAFGAMPRILRIDPASASITPFAIYGPFFGDVNFSCCAYSPLTGEAVVLEDGNDVWRGFTEGASGAGHVFGGYGSPGLGGGLGDTLFVVAPIGNGYSLTGDTSSLSVANGGVQNLDFHPGIAFANDIHLIVGSLSGWAPGFTFAGAHIPLNVDWYSDFTLAAANSAFLVNTFGTIAANGTSLAQVSYPAGVLNGLAGLTMHHAAIAFDGSLQIVHVSNPLALHLLP